MTTRTIKRLKQDASDLKKEKNVALNQALNLVAEKYGYESWQSLTKNAIDGKVTITTSEAQEKTLNQQNKELLAEYGIDFSVLTITATGIKKSIMDAVGSLRNFFYENAFHSYEQQKQGEEYKVVEICALITPEKILDKKVSLYRPTTKSGDPRIWVHGLKPFVEHNDELAFFIIDDQLYVLNLNLVDLSHYSDFLFKLEQSLDEVAIELRNKLIEIAKQPLKAIMKGDTAIGMTVEHALNIVANSSQKPDYKGIELKSGRVTNNRKNLFAQVPNWEISKLKGSGDIVDKYGYERNGDLKLYCTLSATSVNSQGLKLVVDLENDIVNEVHIDDGLVASWEGKMLRKCLINKHKETFWINAEVDLINENEFFSLKDFTHTKNPRVHQLLPLIQQGVVTIDHLIKRKNTTGSAREKGPLFKIKPQALDMLFPEPVLYSLVKV